MSDDKPFDIAADIRAAMQQINDPPKPFPYMIPRWMRDRAPDDLKETIDGMVERGEAILVG